MLEIKTHYTPEESFLENGRGKVRIGSDPGAFYPYDLLLGSLSACFHSTLYDILVKNKMAIPTVEIIVTGDKRKEVPTTLSWVNLDITVTGEVDENKFNRFIDLAGKYCSIHETISKVATVTHEVHFKPAD